MVNILEEVYRTSLKFLIPLTPKETYLTIIKQAMKFVNGDMGSILLEDNKELKRVYASNPKLYKIIPKKKGYMYTVFKTLKPLIIIDKNVAKIHPEVKKLDIHSVMIVPLSYENKPLGVLSILTRKENFFNKKDLKILNIFSVMASLAIRKTQLYDELKEALDARDHFIAMVAHELRTPLTSVNGYIQLLRSKLSSFNTSESRWVEQLYGESVRLTNLIDEFLEINRIKSGNLTYHLKACSLKKIIDSSIDNFRFSYPDRQLIFEDKIQCKEDTVIGDYDKILQMLNNLLGNAAKFSDPDKQIKMELLVRDGYFSVEIKDRGIGISKKDLPGIYEMYSRGEGHTKEGIGLGLFLVKDIVRRHHGSVSIKSKPGKGTNVKIRLPKAKI